MNLGDFFAELKRRNVYKVALASALSTKRNLELTAI
jgi:hypothetical protein